MTLRGNVNAELEATLPLLVMGEEGCFAELVAVVDTGFNGYLTLPSATIASLGLAFHSLAPAELGDGREVTLRKFQGCAQWFQTVKPITVLEADGGPLVGMALLKDHRLTVDVTPGGIVEIQPMADAC